MREEMEGGVDPFSLEGRVAIVTGGGTGIGRSIALLLARYGADVVVAGRRPEPLERTAKDIQALGRVGHAVPSDVTDRSQCEELVAAAFGHGGQIDVLVNNAGGSPMKPPLEWTDEEWHELLELNLSSAWFMSRAAARPMLDRGCGSIVNISSGAGFRGVPTMVPYGAAKAGLINLTNSLAAAWTPQGVRVNAVAAGIVRTEPLQREADRLGFDPDSIGAKNAMNRVADPDEIATAVLYFASDASSFCSGQTLAVDGGPKPG